MGGKAEREESTCNKTEWNTPLYKESYGTQTLGADRHGVGSTSPTRKHGVAGLALVYTVAALLEPAYWTFLQCTELVLTTLACRARRAPRVLSTLTAALGLARVALLYTARGILALCALFQTCDVHIVTTHAALCGQTRIVGTFFACTTLYCTAVAHNVSAFTVS